ncbi:cell division protein SepF [Micrococcus sp.]|uniref:cell division protein SepF n=1 Tax=Micrococcus sp. TaxID=1271 RepID=UPI002A90869E|nr:cell division protein SepF [Micrococcus sp.]MDY6055556.1 cell division protein SepF [Micrococcus sp.]
MAGGLKKTMIYLGLADGDEYEEQVRPAPRADDRREVVAARRASDLEDEHMTEPSHVADVAPVPSTGAGSSVAPEPEPAPRRPVLAEPDEPGYRAPVTPIKRAAASSAEGAAVRTLSTVHPRSYNDAKSIGEAFRSGMPVIMNVTELGENEAKRLVDFAAGLVFGLHGSISRITSKVFLLTPSNVEVVGEDGAGSEAGSLYDGD